MLGRWSLIKGELGDAFWVNDHALRRNGGFRLDFLLLSPGLGHRLQASGVDAEHREREKPSDHAAGWIKLGDQEASGGNSGPLRHGPARIFTSPTFFRTPDAGLSAGPSACSLSLPVPSRPPPEVGCVRLSSHRCSSTGEPTGIAAMAPASSRIALEVRHA